MTASTTLSITLHSTQGTKILVDVADAEADRVLEAWDLELRRTVGRGLVTIADVDGGRLSIPAGEILLMTTEKSAA